MLAMFHESQTPDVWEVTGIQRVQNRRLWKDFSAKQEKVADQSGGNLNERLLFHGTDPHSMLSIIRNGFDPAVSNLTGALGGGV